MLLLTSTSDIIRVVTGAAVTTITAHADWVDLLSGAVTPGRTNTNITTATTTTVVGSPAASTQRNVRGLTITNNSGSSSSQVTVQHYDGTTSTDLFGVTLLAGENIVYGEDGAWRHHDAQGAEYFYAPIPSGNMGPTGCIAETFPRNFANTNTSALTSGTLRMQAIYLYAGQLVSNITIISATTGVTSPTNYRFALYSGARAKLAESADQTTSAWAANTAKTLAMTTPYRVPTSGIYYIGIMLAATTVCTLAGAPALANAAVASMAPIMQGNTSDTGLTTSIPANAGAITGATSSFYAAVT